MASERAKKDYYVPCHRSQTPTTLPRPAALHSLPELRCDLAERAAEKGWDKKMLLQLYTEGRSTGAQCTRAPAKVKIPVTIVPDV